MAYPSPCGNGQAPFLQQYAAEVPSGAVAALCGALPAADTYYPMVPAWAVVQQPPCQFYYLAGSMTGSNHAEDVISAGPAFAESLRAPAHSGAFVTRHAQPKAVDVSYAAEGSFEPSVESTNDEPLDVALADRQPFSSNSQRRRRQRIRAALAAGTTVPRTRRPKHTSSSACGIQEATAATATDPVPEETKRVLAQLEVVVDSPAAVDPDDVASAELSVSSLFRKVEVWRLALDPTGCRVVQLALQAGSRAVQAEIVERLRGHVRGAVPSPNANYVLQKIVEVLPADAASFVPLELMGFASATARHRFGCRVVSRLLEHSSTDPRTVALVEEMLHDAADLCRHEFGHHVVQSLLEHGLPHQREAVARAMHGKLMRSVRNRNASYVIEKALLFCDDGDRRAMASELLAHSENILVMARCQVGCYVIKTLLQMPTEHAELARRYVEKEAAQLRTSRYGKRLLDDLGQGEFSLD